MNVGSCRFGNILNTTPQSRQRRQASLPAIKGAIRSEGVTFGYRIEDGVPDALLGAGGRY